MKITKEGIFSIKTIVIFLGVLVVLNVSELIMQANLSEDVMNVEQEHIKQEHMGKPMTELCSTMVRRYERRALMIGYSNLNSTSFQDIQIKNTSDIPIENIIYVKLNDTKAIPVAYFDDHGYLQTLILPPDQVDITQ